MSELTIIGFAFLLSVLVTLAVAGISGAPFVPTRKKDVERVLSLAGVGDGDRVVDLGCGDGRVMVAAAQAGAEATGYEIALLPLWLAWMRVRLSKVGRRCRLVPRDFWNADLSEADVIFTFLVPATLERLADKLSSGLKPGTRIVNAVWPIPGMSPEAVNRQSGQPDLYLYVVPKRDAS